MQKPTAAVKGPFERLHGELQACFSTFRDVTIDKQERGGVAAKVGRFAFAKLFAEGEQLKISLRVGQNRINDRRVRYDKGKDKDWVSLYVSPSDRVDDDTELLIERAYNFTRWKCLRSWAPRRT